MQVLYSARIDQPEPDARRRLWVTLQRTAKPTTYKHFCLVCGTKLQTVELVNLEPVVVSDTMDTIDTDRAAVGIRCPGKYFDEGQNRLVNCRTYYYWSLDNPHG